MRILLTGVAGFIGFHLALELLKRKHSIIGVDNLNSYYSAKYKKHRIEILKKNKNFKFKKIDLKNKRKLSLLFKKNKPECVFHLASQPGIMYSFKNPSTYISNNISATKNLILVSINYKVKKFYFTSSSSVYGNKKKFPIKENSKLKPINVYAKTKKQCEIMLIKCFKKTNIDLKIFRPFTVYGTYARPDMIFLTYLKKSLENKSFYLFNKGNYMRDFTYVGDVAKILTKFLSVGKIKNKIFNICSSKPIKIKKIIPIINKYSKQKCKIVLKPYRKGEMIKTYGDNNKIRKIVSFKKFTNINVGIKKTIKWYLGFKNKDILYFDKVKY